MKILHISKYYFPFRGGTEQIAQDCVNALKDKYEQKVFCFNEGSNNTIDRVDDIEIIRAGCIKRIASQPIAPSYGKILKEVIDSFKPDIIVFHYPNPFGAFYLLKYIPDNCKLIIYWHLDIVKQRILKYFFIGQNKNLIKRSNILIATSPTYVEGSPWLFKAKEKCRIIPNCINEERLQISNEVIERAKKIREENKGIICFAVGRHTEYKGFKYLIRAAHLLDENYHIYIAGKGEETNNLMAEAGDDKKIHFLGSIDDVELKAYLTASDIFCFPSITKNEAFGVALAEAMYFGKPAITFHIVGSGVNYVCINGENGIEVPNKDIIAYADAIKTLAQNQELRIMYGNAGKKRVMDHFLNNQFKNNIIKAIDSLEC